MRRGGQLAQSAPLALRALHALWLPPPSLPVERPSACSLPLVAPFDASSLGPGRQVAVEGRHRALQGVVVRAAGRGMGHCCDRTDGGHDAIRSHDAYTPPRAIIAPDMSRKVHNSADPPFWGLGHACGGLEYSAKECNFLRSIALCEPIWRLFGKALPDSAARGSVFSNGEK